MKNSETYPKYISNEPCQTDLFAGEPHNKLASKIAEFIKKNLSNHIIGIDGGWGSGKSNLVSLVNKALNSNEAVLGEEGENLEKRDFPIIIYDAWGHQSDLQRRSILEELTSKLVHSGLLSNGWKEKLEDLLAKKRKTDTKIVPKLSEAVVINLFLVLITPIVSFLTSFRTSSIYLNIAIVCACLAPYIAGWIYIYRTRTKSMKKNGQEITFRSFFEELFLVYSDKIKEDTTYETIMEKEPTSVQFKDWMHHIDTDISKKGKTLIIVFDNMDRLPTIKVQELWAAIHSFFADEKYSHIKVIVPFDREHIKKAFESEDMECCKTQLEKGETEKTYFGNDFINKTFSVVYRVSPPILTGWKQYLEDKWQEAFNYKIDTSISQLLELLENDKTPRKIIAFVNECVTIKQLVEDVPDQYIALFSFVKEKISNDTHSLLRSSYLPKEVQFLYDNDQNLVKYMSALYYQLPVESAMDIVFTDTYTQAMNNNDTEVFDNVNDDRKLIEILENSITDVLNIPNAIKTVNVIKISDNEKDTLWATLYKKQSKSPLSKKYDESQRILLKHIKQECKKEYVAKLLSGYQSNNTKSTANGDGNDSTWNTKEYIHAIDEILAEEPDITKEYLKNSNIIVAPEYFIELVQEKKENYAIYGLKCERNALCKYLEELDTDKLSNINIVPYIKNAYNLDDFKQHIETKIKETGNNSQKQEIYFNKYKELVDKVHVKDLLDDSTLYNLFLAPSTSENFKNDLLAMRISRGNSYNSSYRGAFISSLSDDEESHVNGLVNVITEYLDYGDILMLSEEITRYPLIKKVVKVIHKKNDSETQDITSFILHFDDINRKFKDEVSPSDFINFWNGWSEYLKIDETNYSYISLLFLEEASKIDNALTETLKNQVSSILKNLNQEKWKEQILGDNEAYSIWLNYSPIPLQDLFDAISEILKEYARNEGEQPTKTSIMKSLDILNQKFTIKNLIEEVCGILISSHNVTKDTMVFLGELLFSYSVINNENFENLFPSDILSDDDIIKLLQNHVKELKNIKLPSSFKTKLKEMAEKGKKEDGGYIEFCQQLGLIEQPKRKELISE